MGSGLPQSGQPHLGGWLRSLHNRVDTIVKKLTYQYKNIIWNLGSGPVTGFSTEKIGEDCVFINSSIEELNYIFF